MSDERSLSANAPSGGSEAAPPAQSSSTLIAALPSREQLLEMTPTGRVEVISRARQQYAAAASRAESAMAELRNVPRDSDRAQEIEREYVSCLQELGTTVSTVLDAREIDEVGDDSSNGVDDEMRLAAIRATRSKYPEGVLAYTKLYQAVNAGDAEGEAEFRKALRDLPPGKRPTGASAFKTLHAGMEKADAELLEVTASKRRAILREELGNFGSFGGVTPAAKYTRLTKIDRARYDESLAMYPDSLIKRTWEVCPPVEVKKTTARAHYARAVAFGPVRDAMVFHHPLGGGEMTPQSLASAAERIRSTGSPTFSRSVTASQKNIGYLKDLGISRFKSVDSMFMENTLENRKSMEEFAAAHNSAAGKSDDMAVSEVDLPGQGTHLVLTNAGGTFFADSRTPVSSVTTEVTTDGTVSTSVHELAHRMESQDERIGRACKRFLADRTEGLGARRYGRNEAVVEDSFVDQYVGKRYPDEKNASEVFSVGMDAISSGRFGGLTGRPDPTDPARKFTPDHEHRNLVIGLLAGLASAGEK